MSCLDRLDEKIDRQLWLLDEKMDRQYSAVNDRLDRINVRLDVIDALSNDIRDHPA